MSNTHPLVSILIPTYNQAGYIERAVYSALSLNYPNLDVVVSDDNSSDETFHRIKNIRSPLLRVFHNQCTHGRVANYRLLLYKYSLGKYILMLDGDDWLAESSFLEQAVSIMEASAKVSAVSGLTSLVSLNGIYDTTVIPKKQYPTGPDLLVALPFHKSFLSHSATLYRRDQAINASFYSLDVRSSDWDSLYRLCHHGTIRYLDVLVSFWRLHSNNASLEYSPHESIANLAIWDKIYYAKRCSSRLLFVLLFGAKNLCRARSIFNDICLAIKQEGIVTSCRYLASVFRAYPSVLLALPAWTVIQSFLIMSKYLNRTWSMIRSKSV